MTVLVGLALSIPLIVVLMRTDGCLDTFGYLWISLSKLEKSMPQASRTLYSKAPPLAAAYACCPERERESKLETVLFLDSCSAAYQSMLSAGFLIFYQCVVCGVQ